MVNDINLLLNKKDSDLLKQQRRVNVVRITAVLSLIAVLLFSLSVFLLTQSFSLSSIKKDQDSLLSKMLVLRQKQVKLVTINNRIQNIFDVLNKRVDNYKIVNTILGKMPDGVSVENLELKEKTISVTVSSSSLLPLDGFINNLTDMARRKEIISTLVLDSLSLNDPTRSYLLSINANLLL